MYTDHKDDLTCSSTLHMSEQVATVCCRADEETLADAFEALAGAVYLDSGLEAASKFLIELAAVRLSLPFVAGLTHANAMHSLFMSTLNLHPVSLLSANCMLTTNTSCVCHCMLAKRSNNHTAADHDNLRGAYLLMQLSAHPSSCTTSKQWYTDATKAVAKVLSRHSPHKVQKALCNRRSSLSSIKVSDACAALCL